MTTPLVVVSGIILNKRGEMLLVKSHKWRNRYGVPGGKLIYGESIEKALAREMKEEVGINIKNARFLTVREDISRKRHIIFIVHTCKADSSRVRLDRRELNAYAWTKPERALKMNLDIIARDFVNAFLKARK